MKHRLKEIRKKHSLNQTEMAELMGLTLRGYQYIEKGERGLDPKYIKLAADALAIPESDFYEETVRINVSQVRVLGEVQAGVWMEAVQWDHSDTFEIPYGVPERFKSKAYGLRVVGDSMNLVYPDGTVVIVVPVWEYSDEIPSGKRVIVERRKKDGIVEATAKELEVINGHAKLWPRSTNPKFQQAVEISWPYDEPQKVGVETVEIKGVIIGSYRTEE